MTIPFTPIPCAVVIVVSLAGFSAAQAMDMRLQKPLTVGTMQQKQPSLSSATAARISSRSARQNAAIAKANGAASRKASTPIASMNKPVGAAGTGGIGKSLLDIAPGSALRPATINPSANYTVTPNRSPSVQRQKSNKQQAQVDRMEAASQKADNARQNAKDRLKTSKDNIQKMLDIQRGMTPRF